MLTAPLLAIALFFSAMLVVTSLRQGKVARLLNASATVRSSVLSHVKSGSRALTALSMGPKEKVSAAIKDNKIMVFSKTYCPYCKKAKQALTDMGLQFKVQELDLDEKEGPAIQQALQDLTGQRTVPNIFLKGAHLGGCDNTLAAIADGKLKKMLDA